ncbi:TolC family protein [Fusobacterium necrophorum]|uniref:TolC family protein n=1 Tax=Fusobacterium necrophorum TaxID=859 RepID=UPI0025508437|nr:TolC family protein [Fusobacterium necrophorum]MDK4487072.1 TolC family protein [Fusobacterium necrophorum]
MKKLWILFFLLGSVAFGREVTLEEAIQASMENSKAVKISDKQLEISKLKMNQAIKKALPSVVYSANYQRGEYERNIYKNKSSMESEKGGYKQSITVSQPIFQGGAILAGIQGAKAYKTIADLSYVQETLNTRLKTIRTFSNIVNSKRNLQALEYSEKQLQNRYKKQEAQLELRLITKTDLLKTEYSLLEVQSLISKAKSNIEVQTEDLKFQMGVDKKEALEVKEFIVPNHLTERITFEKDKERALESSIQALIAKSQVKIAKAQETAALGNMLPKVNAFVSYGVASERTHWKQTREDAEWMGGLSVSWNVFSFGSDYDAYQIAKLEKESKELSETTAQDNIALSLKTAYLELQRLEILRESRKRGLEAAELNFTMDQEKFDAGLLSTVDYLSSETQLREARVNYYQAELDYYYAFEYYRSLLV